MKVIFLGTNGWYDSGTGNSVCALAKFSDANLVLDAGNGIYKLDKYIKDSNPIYIFISHLHLDHTAGLHVLNKFRFPQGVKILVGPGMKKQLNRLLNPPYSAPIKKIGLVNEIIEFPDRRWPRWLKIFPLRHSVDCFGLRAEKDGKILAYAADTTLCPGLSALAKSADVLIAECSYRPGERRAEWPHLNPEDAASCAKKAGAKLLVLTHFEAARYPRLKDRLEAQKAARGIFPKTIAARDGTVL